MITWIASYPKSGSTWVRGFLSAYLNHGELDINKMRFLDVDDITSYFYHIVTPRNISNFNPNEIVQFRGAALSHMSLLLDYPLIKTHMLNGEIDGIQMIPQCLTDRAIYIMRDPRDVAVSISHQFEWTLDEAVAFINNPRQLIFREGDFKGLFNYVGMWSQHIVSWGDEKTFRVLLVKYEDLITHQEKAFKQIVEFLDWEVDEELLVKSVKISSFSEMKKQEESKGFRENRGKTDFFREGKVEGWRDILSEAQLVVIEEQNFDVMERVGYGLVTMDKATSV